MTAAADRSGLSQTGRVVAWDLPTRLFKWLLVLLVVNAWLSDKYGAATPIWHKANGYAILILIVFRILWGFAGGSTARFSAFVTWPWRALGYALAQLRGAKTAFLGHNPLGGWMILLLLAALAGQAILGLYSADSDRLVIEGPLAATISDAAVDKATSLHRLGFNIILALVTVHVLANVFYDVVKRDGLIAGMVTGRKRAAAYVDQREARPGSPLVALLLLVVSAAIVFGAIMLLGGRPFR